MRVNPITLAFFRRKDLNSYVSSGFYSALFFSLFVSWTFPIYGSNGTKLDATKREDSTGHGTNRFPTVHDFLAHLSSMGSRTDIYILRYFLTSLLLWLRKSIFSWKFIWFFRARWVKAGRFIRWCRTAKKTAGLAIREVKTTRSTNGEMNLCPCISIETCAFEALFLVSISIFSFFWPRKKHRCRAHHRSLFFFVFFNLFSLIESAPPKSERLFFILSAHE